MADLVLYNYFRSSTSYRVRIALHLKGLAFDSVPVHLLKNEQNAADFRKLNPQGEVPALLHKGRAISQSLPILEYLDEVFPEPSIYPRDPFERARVRQFCENINSYLHPLANLKVLQYLEARHGYDQPAKEQWVRHWMEPGLQTLESMLATSAGKFSFGDQVTAADLCLIPALFSARRFNVDTDRYPLASRIEKDASTLEVFAKAHPLRQSDTPPEMKIS